MSNENVADSSSPDHLSSVLGPMPVFPTLKVYTEGDVTAASPEELRLMVWQMSESMAMLNQIFDDVMATMQRREAVLLEKLQEQKQSQQYHNHDK